MLHDSPPAVRAALLAARVRVGIISVVEYTMDIPENQNPRNMDPREAAYQDRRSRGLGGLPLATCAEENLLNLRGDPYTAENITIHEFSHTVASSRRAPPAWYERICAGYFQAEAMAEGLFAGSYSATNEQEYWAEGAQAWFDCAARRKDATTHSGIWNRAGLSNMTRVWRAFGRHLWRWCVAAYVKTTSQPVRRWYQLHAHAGLDHLIGLNRNEFPVFSFNNSPRIIAAATLPAVRGQ